MMPEDFEQLRNFERLNRIVWTELSKCDCDPIGDIRVGAAVIYLERPLTKFESIVVRAGLTTGMEFPR